MKKLLSVTTLFLLFVTQAKAQKEVSFKVKMMPNHVYSAITKMDMNIEMTMTGDSTIIKQATKNGVTFPMIMKMEMGYNSNAQTHDKNLQNNIPFVMNIQSSPTKMTINGSDSAVPIPATNQTLFGAFTEYGKAMIDSISGQKMTEQLKEASIKTIEGMQANIKFPDKPIKIGDTFDMDVPMDIPIAGIPAKVISKTTYKLISIENNMAYFDFSYIMTMDVNGQSISMDLTGNGDGKLTFDRIANYPVKMDNNMNMKYSMTMPQAKDVKINGKAKMVMTNQTTITNK